MSVCALMALPLVSSALGILLLVCKDTASESATSKIKSNYRRNDVLRR